MAIADTIRISNIQGTAHTSPLVGQAVSQVPGIVTALRFNGFYLQDPNPDENQATSEGIFVFTAAAPALSIGDSVLVSGTVSEFRPGGASGLNNLSITQISDPTITSVSSGNPLPPSTVVGNGGWTIPTTVIEDDATGNVETSGSFDADADGIDFYESLEGMLVQVNNAVAVGPTNDFGEIPILADQGENAGTRTARGGIVIQPEDFNPERILIDDAIVATPRLNVGDRFNDAVTGVIDYSFGNFKLLSTAPLPQVTSGGLTPEMTSLTGSADQLTVATFNVENLDPNDGSAKFGNLASLIVNNLKSPDIISLEEVQDNNGPTNDRVVAADQTYQTLIDAIVAVAGPTYEYRQIDPVDDQDGGEPGGNIRVGFLFNPQRVDFVDRPGGTATANTTVNSGVGPVSASPGRLIDVNLADGDAFSSSRKPLVGEFLFNSNTVFVIGNHFNSKGGDQPLFGRFQPPTLTTEAQRLQQAEIVNNFVESLLAIDPDANVVVMGDFNDFQFSQPIATLRGDVLSNLVDTLPLDEQYSYIFEGNSQTLDHILVSNNLLGSAEYDVVHVNAEFADQVSDHEPLVARFNLPTPTSAPAEITLRAIGTYQTGVFGESAAEIVAYDPGSQRLFVVNAQNASLDVLGISDPTDPSFLTSIDVSPFGAVANSVDIFKGVVAVAVENVNAQMPGEVVFFNTDGDFISSVGVGALPDMLTFTPDGQKVLVANEGEPSNNYTFDPEGSVSIIDLSAGVENLSSDNVTLVDFRAFNNRKAELQAEGVRLFGPNASVAQDLEPEYISISPDGETAWVTLQENNAIAVLDINSATITNLLPLGFKDHSKGLPTLTTYEFTDLPTLSTTAASPLFPNGQEIKLGGFSGLFFEGAAENGNLQFVTHPDRGPNGEPTNLLPNVPGSERPFPLPDFQPEIVRFELNRTTGQIGITERLSLTRQDGTPLSGLPNLQAGAAGTAYTDETPVDLFGNLLPNDPLGADLEGIAVAGDGTFWMVDEYRPAIYHFDTDGRLLDRFIPEGTAVAGSQPAGTFGTEALPAVYAQRRANRGFEAVALEGTKLYAFIQSPIDNPDSTGDTTSRDSSNLRILEFDVDSQSVTGEYLYVLKDISGSGDAKTDKIGDAVSLGNGKFLVLERDDQASAVANKLVFEIDLKGATNLNTFDLTLPAGTIETLSYNELLAAGIQPVQKRAVTNLGPLGYVGVEKPEGLALIDANTIAVINDNDFGLLGQPVAGDGSAPLNPSPEPILLGLVEFGRSNGLDASDRDSAINIANYPVFGIYQPDGIAAYNANGETFFITANEGDSRDYGTFSEEARVAALNLDPAAFPNAALLQANSALGRLQVTNANGDTDGDGDFDQLYAFGGRSFSIWDAQGNLVYDSGDDFERITASLLPEAFNSDNAENESFDTRSDNKGPEPEGITTGVIGDRTYAFIGLERIGGVIVYDVTNPRSPEFLQYVNNRDFSGSVAAGTAGDLGPEGLRFIAAPDSPNGQPLLVVASEVSGTTSIFEIALQPRNITGPIAGVDESLLSGDDILIGGEGATASASSVNLNLPMAEDASGQRGLAGITIDIFTPPMQDPLAALLDQANTLDLSIAFA